MTVGKDEEIDHMNLNISGMDEDISSPFSLSPQNAAKVGALVLTAEQMAIVCSRSDQRVIVADAGTAKTTVLVEAVAHDIEEGWDPSKILVVTYSTVGAIVLNARLVRRCSSAGAVAISTIHAMGLRLIRQDPSQFGFSSVPTVLQERQQKCFIARKLRDLGVCGPEVCSAFMAAYCWARNNRKTSAEMFARIPMASSRSQAVLDAYCNYKSKTNTVDFEDILVLTAEKIRTSVLFRENLAAKFNNVFIDEAQDTSRAQWDIILPISRRLFVVGDPKQSIYGWRGGIGDFSSICPHAAKFTLHRNFRSSPQIVAVANTIYDTGLRTERKDGPKPVLRGHANAAEEAAEVAKLVAHYSAKTTAVLARTWEQLRLTAVALSVMGISVENPGDHGTPDLKSLIGFIALFLWGCGERDEGVWRNCLAAVGKKDVEKERFPAADGSLLSPLDLVFLTNRQRQIFDKISALSLAKIPFPLSIRLFYEELYAPTFGDDTDLSEAVDVLVNLASNRQILRRFIDKTAPPKQSVVVSTVHGQKGEEYELVFVIGLNEGLFPLGNTETPVEERNLFYVALTRAERLLFLSFLFADGRGRTLTRSSFLDEIDPRLLSFDLPSK